MSRLDLSSFSPNESSSDDDGESIDEEESFFNDKEFSEKDCDVVRFQDISNPLNWMRCLIHVDVDCFYCQCEEIDGPPDYKDRPIAIGQKHIIVTCNYVARREYGIKKLQLRAEAKRKCPNLLIIEGSDLERYRKHSRSIYNMLRGELETIKKELLSTDNISNNRIEIPAAKGGFDECFADLTNAVEAIIKQNRSIASVLPRHTYVFGDDPSSSKASITEDQSGQTSIICHRPLPSPSLDNRVSCQGKNGAEQKSTMERLHVTAMLSERIKNKIREKTGFTVTIGVSVSPMLAKLTSDLNKPNGINILYPWRSSSIILPMPLRKIPNLGSRTLKNLQECLKQHNPHTQKDFWTCRDLLQVPRQSILACLAKMQSYEKSCNEQCDLILQRCRGIDPSTIIDDNGGLAKTVSVENSFRRGTVLNQDAVWEALKDLFVRLPKLLDERKLNSDSPKFAFPTTIRLTARVVDYTIQKRRPFVTRSKQGDFNGKQLMTESGMCKRSNLIRRAVAPLLEYLVFQGNDINLTRINIALTNFADLKTGSTSPASIQKQGKRDRSIAYMLSQSSPSNPDSSSCTGKKRCRPESKHSEGYKNEGNDSHTSRSNGLSMTQNKKFSFTNNVEQRSVGNGARHGNTRANVQKRSKIICPKGIDPEVFSELPPDIAAEVCQAPQLSHQIYRSGGGGERRHTKTLDYFFKSKK